MSSSRLVNSEFINRLITIEKNSFNSENHKLNFGQYYISQSKRYALNNKGQFEITEFFNRVIEVFSIDDIVGYTVVGKYNNNNTIDYIPETERVQNIGYIEITKDGVKKAHIKAAEPQAGKGALEEWIISDDFETIESKYILNSGIGDYTNRPTVWISHLKKFYI